VGRWEPNARGRLEEAALELYAQRGYDQVTVAEIAERAGLTERTFYRHFADKREVLFAGGLALEELLAAAVAGTPAEASAYAAVEAAMVQVAEVLRGRSAVAPRRQAIIEAHPELRERELGKMASWSVVLAEALRARGVEPQVAQVVAQAGVAVFRVAFEAWVRGGASQDPTAVVREAFEQLRAAAGD
jgi:AcrR family transcriptional regulator